MARISIGKRGEARVFWAYGRTRQEALNALSLKVDGLHDIPAALIESGEVDRDALLRELQARCAELEEQVKVERMRHQRASKGLRKAVLDRDKGRCRYCGEVVSASTAHLDHYVPRIYGGATTYENLVTACSRCNTRKRNRLPHQLGEVGMRLRDVR